MQGRSLDPFLEEFLPAFSRPRFALQGRSTIQVGFEARLPALCFFFFSVWSALELHSKGWRIEPTRRREIEAWGGKFVVHGRYRRVGPRVVFVTQTSPSIWYVCHMTKGEQKDQVSTRINLLKKAAVISKQPKFWGESREHVGFKLLPEPASSGKASTCLLCFVFNVIVLSSLSMFAGTDVKIGQSSWRKWNFNFGWGVHFNACFSFQALPC